MLTRQHARLAPPRPLGRMPLAPLPPPPAAARTLGQMPESPPPSFPVVPVVFAWAAVVASAGVIWWMWFGKGRARFAPVVPPPERLA